MTAMANRKLATYSMRVGMVSTAGERTCTSVCESPPIMPVAHAHRLVGTAGMKDGRVCSAVTARLQPVPDARRAPPSAVSRGAAALLVLLSVACQLSIDMAARARGTRFLGSELMSVAAAVSGASTLAGDFSLALGVH